ncbi:tetratricopeptide repeat protein [Nitrospirillum amazonense]|uniref:Tetratricopeptide repeat protein n=1 Tax=Nitrospirillum amazonense TaxID=28077 RepID=A0A560KA99_9PROT|nr:tetratricopeptide repeat protein [Nitrospirillum amazonense]MDG3441383.1 tetratricopeptide repeat protein [Nitrospirillum amazonense]TWB80126.1 tetratricopeptide repeat protein [Nitrospirillum amazonense]
MRGGTSHPLPILALLACAACAGPPAGGTTAPPVKAPSVAPSLPTADLTPDPVLGKALLEGLLAVRAGDARRAVDGYFNPVINAYERRYKAVPGRLYCARSMEEAARYMKDALRAHQPARVVEAGLVLAYVYRARELMILDDPAGAQVGLERARALSPANAAVLLQLGAAYKAQRMLPQAQEAYQAAVDSADLSPPETRPQETADAFYGLGSTYVAMGRLDEAEATYQRCLKVLPGNALAEMELKEIERQRAQGH